MEQLGHSHISAALMIDTASALQRALTGTN